MTVCSLQFEVILGNIMKTENWELKTANYLKRSILFIRRSSL